MMGHKRTTKKSNFATTAFVQREHLGFRGRARIVSVGPFQHEDHGIAVHPDVFYLWAQITRSRMRGRAWMERQWIPRLNKNKCHNKMTITCHDFNQFHLLDSVMRASMSVTSTWQHHGL